MKLYIQHGAKLIVNQLGCLYRHCGANSDGAACFLICTSLISQQFYATKFASGWPHPVVDSLSWFAIFHLARAALFEATGPEIVCRPWLCVEH